MRENDKMLGACRAAIIDADPETQFKVALGLVIEIINNNDHRALVPVFAEITAVIEREAHRQRTAH